jgi:hypothetical protein
MNVLTTLLVVLALAVGLTVLLPVLGAGLALLAVAACFFIWLLPILIIVASDRTTAGEKLAWILAIVFLSWFAWIFYFLLAPIKKRDPWDDRYDHDRDYARRRDRYDLSRKRRRDHGHDDYRYRYD